MDRYYNILYIWYMVMGNPSEKQRIVCFYPYTDSLPKTHRSSLWHCGLCGWYSICDITPLLGWFIKKFSRSTWFIQLGSIIKKKVWLINYFIRCIFCVFSLHWYQSMFMDIFVFPLIMCILLYVYVYIIHMNICRGRKKNLSD